MPKGVAESDERGKSIKRFPKNSKGEERKAKYLTKLALGSFARSIYEDIQSFRRMELKDIPSSLLIQNEEEARRMQKDMIERNLNGDLAVVEEVERNMKSLSEGYVIDEENAMVVMELTCKAVQECKDVLSKLELTLFHHFTK